MTISRDLKNNLKFTKALDGAVISSNTTTAGDWIDLKNGGSALFEIRSSARTDGIFTPSIEVANASDKSDAAAIDSSLLIGSYADAVINAANTVKTIGFLGAYKYARLKIASTSVTTGAHLAASCVMGELDFVPNA